MERLGFFARFSAASAIALIAGHTQAATLTETFRFGGLVGYGSESGTSFAEFNPKLGTLNSATISASATETFSGGGSQDMNHDFFELTLNGLRFDTFSQRRVGNGPAGVSIFDTLRSSSPLNLPELRALTGTGLVRSAISVRDASFGSAHVSTAFNKESVTYNYTPATPLPATLPLFAGGIGIISLLLRRKTRRDLGRPITHANDSQWPAAIKPSSRPDSGRLFRTV